MPKFDDLINSIGVGEDGISIAYPDTFLDDMRGAYAADMEIPEAQIQVLTAENAELKQANTLLMAENYQLIKQIPSNDPAPIEDEGEDDSESDEDITTDDLFGDDDDTDN